LLWLLEAMMTTVQIQEMQKKCEALRALQCIGTESSIALAFQRPVQAVFAKNIQRHFPPSISLAILSLLVSIYKVLWF
jgi:hypothetical protein